jgi:hypothetical protein
VDLTGLLLARGARSDAVARAALGESEGAWPAFARVEADCGERRRPGLLDHDESFLLFDDALVPRKGMGGLHHESGRELANRLVAHHTDPQSPWANPACTFAGDFDLADDAGRAAPQIGQLVEISSKHLT